jgi:hypothetical protein
LFCVTALEDWDIVGLVGSAQTNGQGSKSAIIMTAMKGSIQHVGKTVNHVGKVIGKFKALLIADDIVLIR